MRTPHERFRIICLRPPCEPISKWSSNAPSIAGGRVSGFRRSTAPGKPIFWAHWSICSFGVMKRSGTPFGTTISGRPMPIRSPKFECSPWRFLSAAWVRPTAQTASCGFSKNRFGKASGRFGPTWMKRSRSRRKSSPTTGTAPSPQIGRRPAPGPSSRRSTRRHRRSTARPMVS